MENDLFMSGFTIRNMNEKNIIIISLKFVLFKII